jgi:hypothetical protein
MGHEDRMLMKFRRPLQIYFKWLSSPGEGTEVLYADGWNANRLRAHRGDFLSLINFNLDPHGHLAMAGHGHAITEAGLAYMTAQIGAGVRRAAARAEFIGVDHGPDMIYGKPVTRIEAIFPRDPARGYAGYRVIIWADRAAALPLRTELYDFDNRLFETYGYEDLVLNPGLTSADFDPANRDYRF